jgi:hypothetical protein
VEGGRGELDHDRWSGEKGVSGPGGGEEGGALEACAGAGWVPGRRRRRQHPRRRPQRIVPRGSGGGTWRGRDPPAGRLLRARQAPLGRRRRGPPPPQAPPPPQRGGFSLRSARSHSGASGASAASGAPPAAAVCTSSTPSLRCINVSRRRRRRRCRRTRIRWRRRLHPPRNGRLAGSFSAPGRATDDRHECRPAGRGQLHLLCRRHRRHHPPRRPGDGRGRPGGSGRGRRP